MTHHLLALSVLGGCKHPTEPTTDTSSHPTSSIDSGPGDSDSTGTTPTLPPLGTECDEAIGVPEADGTASASPADPHANVFGTVGPDPVAVRYSWPGNDPSTDAAFVWRTDVDTLATVVEYGTGGQLTARVEGKSFRFGKDEAFRVHEVKLCGRLEPGTTYQYHVGGDGHFSPMYTFTTPGPPGSFDTFRVAFTGDSRGAYEAWSQVMQAMDSFDPDFFLFTGDSVASGSNQEEWDAWYRATGDILTGKAMIPTHGNHESLSQNFFAQVSLPGNEQWFTIRYGPMHLVVLNDTPAAWSTDWEDQATYLDRSFGEALPGSFGVAMHHQGMYATCATHGSNEALRDVWVPKYDDYGVRLVLNGHNHIYERSVPIRDGVEVEPAAGTTYLTVGGAGAPLYKTSDTTEWFGAVADPVHHFGIADFGPDGVQIVIRDLSGNVIDAFTR